jgi:heat shock protein HslJ
MRLAFAALLLAACSTAGGQTTPSPSVSPSPTAPPAGLDGRTFVSTSVVRAGTDFPLVPNTQLRLAFIDSRQLGASAGCNSIFGGYQLQGNVLLVDQLGTTDMACNPPALMAQETWFTQLLSSRPTLGLDGNTLTVTSGDTVITMLDREVAEPDAQLVGPTWTVETIINGESASSVPMGATAWLQFGADGRASLNTGCNSGGGPYTADAGTITFGPIATTKMFCAGPGGQLEQAVLEVLNAQTVDYSIDAQTLSLQAGAAGLQLVAR